MWGILRLPDCPQRLQLQHPSSPVLNPFTAVLSTVVLALTMRLAQQLYVVVNVTNPKYK